MPAKTGNSNVSKLLIDGVAKWLMEQTLADADLNDIVMGTCERLRASGIALVRGHFAFSVLHPLHAAVGITWLRGQGATSVNYPHVPKGESGKFNQSPHYYMMERGLDLLRVRIDCPDRNYEFPIFDDLRAEGLTDYMAFLVDFEEAGRFKSVLDGRRISGMLGSWATDRGTGFGEDEIESLLRIQSRMAVACKLAIRERLMRNVCDTYLGRSAGEHVLNGLIKRGDGQAIDAAIWYSDLRGSTELADRLEPQAYIDCLNDYYDATGGAVLASGGEILSFIGDGLLAIFPKHEGEDTLANACGRAQAACHDANARMKEINRNRRGNGRPVLQYGLALHVGEVMYGNVGVPERLTFSVFGAAVNEVVRMESLTKKLKEPVLVSDAFVNCLGCKLRQVGTKRLRGVEQALTVFALEERPAAVA